MPSDGRRGKRVRRSTNPFWNHGSTSMERCTSSLAVWRRRTGDFPGRAGARRRLHLHGRDDVWTVSRGQPGHCLVDGPSRPWPGVDDGKTGSRYPRHRPPPSRNPRRGRAAGRLLRHRGVSAVERDSGWHAVKAHPALVGGPARPHTVRADPLRYLSEELDALKAQGLYRRLRVLEGEQKAHACFDDRSVVNLSSNNYLGLTTHPKLREAALEATRTLGVGSGSVRTIAGTMAIHMELERRLAEFKRTEATVVFQSGFAANAGTVASVLGKDDFIISDELNHASIIDGARLSRATIKVFPHRDAKAARAIVEALPRERRRLIITDGVFSMDGDLGALPELCDVADEFGCIMMVDDAHASGVFGSNGRGTIDHFKLPGPVGIQGGNLSKGNRPAGRHLAGRRALIQFLYHRGRPFLFSTSPPPAVPAACLAAIDVLEGEPQLIERLS